MLIKNGRLIDPGMEIDDFFDMRIEDGKVSEIDKNLEPSENEEVLDIKGLSYSPGFIDTHVHFRDPGFTYKEDIITGSKAAAKGGYTSVICMANTNPVMDNEKTLVEFLEKSKSSPINVYTICALTEGLKGETLTDMENLIKNKAVGFSDDGIPNMNLEIIIEGMKRGKKLDVPISFHEEDPRLNKENGINHGKVSEKLNIFGAPDTSEALMIARDGILNLEIGGKICIQHISSKKGVDLVRYFKEKGGNIFAEVTPHHFSSTEDLVLEKGSLGKMNPPLRREEDRQAILEGLKDGTISIIATDHAPHSEEEKNKPLLKAPSGIIGLETAFGLGIKNLVKENVLSLSEFIKKLTINPAKLYKLDGGKLEIGDNGDITIFDPEEKWIVKDFSSKSKNSPYIGKELIGKIKYTIVNGKIVYKD